MWKKVGADGYALDALASFRHHEQAIIAKVAARSLERRGEVIQHGENAEHLITSGIQFTTRMLDTAMALSEVALLEDQLAWTQVVEQTSLGEGKSFFKAVLAWGAVIDWGLLVPCTVNSS